MLPRMGVIFLLFLLLCACCSKQQEQRCGEVVEKWQEGRYNSRFLLSVKSDSGVYYGRVSRDYWASHQKGEQACVVY